MQHSNTTPLLPASIGGATGIEEEKAVAVLVPGNMGVAVNDDARVGEFLSCDFFTGVRIAKDMHNTDATMPYHYFAFDRQRSYYFFLFDIALYSNNRGDNF